MKTKFKSLVYLCFCSTTILLHSVANAVTSFSKGNTNAIITVPFFQNNNLNPNSNGTACARTEADSGQQSFTPSGELNECEIEVKLSPDRKLTLKSLGLDNPKFLNLPGGRFTGNFIEVTSKTISPETPSTKSDADALWLSIVGGNPQARTFSANLRVSAKVTQTNRNIRGEAAAESKDPLLFNFDTSGTLEFTFSIGNSLIELDDQGNPLPELLLFSDAKDGSAHFDTNAGFSGVSFNNLPLDGELFLLTIDAEGIITSPADLKINFFPWVGLGLSTSQIANVENYIRSNLSVLSGGGIGLAPGSELPLIGPGGPIDTLTLSFEPTTVTFRDSVAAQAQIPSTPEPSSTLGFLALGTLGAASTLKRKLKSSS